LYGPDAATLMEENDDRRPADYSSVIIRRLTEPGLYFVRVLHADEAVSGEDTAYDLRIYREIGPQTPGSIIGQVVSRDTGAPVAGAQVTVGSMGGFPNWTCGSDGVFHISPVDPGSYTLHATASGYESGSTTASVTSTGQAQPTIRLTPSGPALSLSPGSLLFTVDGDPRPVKVRNSGSGAIQWTASVTHGNNWISVSSNSGEEGDSFTVTVSENDSGSTRSGTIEVRATGATNSPVTLEVTQQTPGDGALQCSSLGSKAAHTPCGDVKGAVSLGLLLLACWVGAKSGGRSAVLTKNA
jgi:hypothetical protein